MNCLNCVAEICSGHSWFYKILNNSICRWPRWLSKTKAEGIWNKKLIFCFLEQKISEFSDTIGHYEKQRYNDQATIHKLKQKLENLEEATSPIVHTTSTPSFEAFDDKNGSVKEKIRTSSSDEYMRYFDSEKMYCKFVVLRYRLWCIALLLASSFH